MTESATIEQLIDSKRFTEAKELINSALADFPRDAEMQSCLSACFGGLGQPEEAIEAANRAIALNHENPEYHRQRAMMLSVSGYHADAEESYAKALSLDPTSVHLKAAYDEAILRQQPKQQSSKGWASPANWLARRFGNR